MFDPLHPTPPGWPPQVRAPGLPGWEESASKWLFEQVPGDWRNQQVYREQPLLLAYTARYYIQGAIQGHRRGYSTARVEIAGYGDITTQQRRDDGGHLDPACVPEIPLTALAELLDCDAKEGARLVALSRQIANVEDALRGVRWMPRKESFG